MGHPDPDVFIDVTSSMDTSVKALMEHKSQMDGHDEAWALERMQEWRRGRAVGRGIQYAEAFRKFTFRR